MKKLILSLFLLSLLSATSCNSDDDSNCRGVDCLPPATQTGEGTFGCLVNGEPFVDNSGFFNCFYQLVDGEYYFGIQAEDNVSNIAAIALGSLKSEIEIGIITPLNLREDNEFYALVDFNELQPEASTDGSDDGFIRFTAFTTNSNVVSAIFEFTVVDPNTNTVYEITNGRFDAQFTQ